MNQPIYLTSCLAENSEPLCHHLAETIQAQLGQSVEVIDDLSWAERAQQLAADSIQMGWICGLLFIRLRLDQNVPLRLLAAPIMQGSDYANRPVYFSHILVRQESPFQTFADLRGVRWGFNELGSFSGYAIVRHHLTTVGEPDSYFSEWMESGSHLNSIQMLLDGRIQATAIDSTLLDYWQQKEPQLASKLRRIHTLGPNPVPPLVISGKIPTNLRQNLRKLLLTLHESERGQAILATNRVARFTAVSEESYRPLYEISK